MLVNPVDHTAAAAAEVFNYSLQQWNFDYGKPAVAVVAQYIQFCTLYERQNFYLHSIMTKCKVIKCSFIGMHDLSTIHQYQLIFILLTGISLFANKMTFS